MQFKTIEHQLNQSLHEIPFQIRNLIEKGELFSAIGAIEEFVSTGSSSCKFVHLHLATLYLSVGRPDKSLKIIPSQDCNAGANSFAASLRSECFFKMGHFGLALAEAEKAISYSKNDVRLILNYARCLDFNGETNRAIKVYRRLLDSGHITEKTLEPLIKFATKDESTISLNTINHAIEKVLGGELDIEGQYVVGLALGEYFERKREIETSFEWYSFSNEQVNSEEKYKREIARLEAIRQVFTKVHYGKNSLYKTEASSIFHIDKDAKIAPVFIVGMPRSGTSLIEQIVGTYPEFIACGELEYFYMLGKETLEEYRRSGDTNNLIFSPAEIIRHKKAFDDLLIDIAGNSKRSISKFPHNFEVLWVIKQIYPDAKILHVKRSQRENCWSCFKSPLGNMHSYANKLENLVEYYSRYQQLMELWERQWPADIFNVEYEQVVKNFNPTIKRMVEWLGLSWNSDCIKFHMNTRNVNSLSYKQVKRPLYTESQDGTHEFNQWLAALDILN